MEVRKIETSRCILRKLELEDSQKVFEILNDEEVTKTLNLETHKSLKDTEKLIEDYLEQSKKGLKVPYAIIEKTTQEFVGVFLIKLDLYNEDAYEFTIYLNKKFWRKGIYSEILPYLTQVAFEDVKTGNFRGYVKEGNVASMKALERCGFFLEKKFKVDTIKEMIYSYLKTSKMYETERK